jgi:hypothetical protein
MATYFKGQANLRIKLETNVTLTGYTCLIKYRKPNNEVGSWAATIDGSDDSKMYYDINSTTTINQEGKWIFWAYYSLGAIVGIGEIAIQQFNTEGY